MVVPLFGWSAGDIVVFIKILCTIAGAFKDASGSKSQYSETSTGLESFASDLERMNEYVTDHPEAKYSQNILQQIDGIQSHYAVFEAYLQKYNKGLSSTAKAHTIRAASQKVKWALGELKGKVDSLKVAVTGPLLSIHLLLALQSGVDLAALGDEVKQLTEGSRSKNVEAAFQALDNKIELLSATQGRLCTDLQDDGALIKQHVESAVGNSTSQMLAKLIESTNYIQSVVETHDASSKRALESMNSHLEQLVNYQTTTSAFRALSQERLKTYSRAAS